MPRYFHRREPDDLDRIEINEQWQITFWSLRLNTTQDRLTQALREVGPEADRVQAWLETNPPLQRYSR